MRERDGDEQVQEPNETTGEHRWEQATRALNAPLPPGLATLFDPPPAAARDQMIARVLRRRRPPTATRRWAWVSATAGSLAVAAALVLAPRTMPVVGPLALEIHAGNRELRSSADDPTANVVFELRNEPEWTVRLASPHADVTLYLVAQHPDGTLALLNPPFDRGDAAFRVRCELRELGLRAGETTLYFMVGPTEAGVEAVRRVNSLLAGEALPSSWSVVTTRVRVRS